MGKVLVGNVFLGRFFSAAIHRTCGSIYEVSYLGLCTFYLEAGVYYKTTFHSETGIFLFKYSYYNIWVIH